MIRYIPWNSLDENGDPLYEITVIRTPYLNTQCYAKNTATTYEYICRRGTTSVRF